MIKNKNIVMCILLTIITCGIYSIIWLYNIAEDVREITNGKTSTGLEVILFSILTCGIYSWFWYYTAASEIYSVENERGIIGTDNSLICVILVVFQLGLISIAILQNEINKFAQN